MTRRLASNSAGWCFLNGGIDCDGAVNPVDSLKILRHDACLDVDQEGGCPVISGAVRALARGTAHPPDSLPRKSHQTGGSSQTTSVTVMAGCPGGRTP